jgi:hypothetical protein
VPRTLSSRSKVGQWLLIWAALPMSALLPSLAGSAHYRLVEGSSLVDDCLICDRPTLLFPLRGSFELAPLESNPLYATYMLTNVQFLSAAPAGTHFQITGSGTYRIGGEVAIQQTLSLALEINDGSTNTFSSFTNAPGLTPLPWPMIRASAIQTNGTLLHTYSVTLVAAPLQEIWFSIRQGLTPSLPGFAPPRLSNGDVLSDSGRVVRRNADLMRRFGLMPSIDPATYDVDALDVGPGGEILFSLRDDVFSETLGWLQGGDLLSDAGRIVKSNQELLAAFVGKSTPPDAGLDGVQMMSNGEILFSISTNVFSDKLGVNLSRGDLLSSTGQIVKTSQQLLSAFQPNPKDGDYGLAAFHVWPSGEVWFNTETGFNSSLGPLLAGDLLSDRGYIVFHNLELVSAFAPVEDLNNFGLDALFLVTDTLPPLPAPRLSVPSRSLSPPDFLLQWDSSGRVFQLQRASVVTGPYLPVSPIIPDLRWLDMDSSGSGAAAFYRLRSW